MSYAYITLFISCKYDRQLHRIMVSNIEIYWIPITSMLINISRHVADKGHSGMSCVHVVSRYLPHTRLELFDSLIKCNLI